MIETETFETAAVSFFGEAAHAEVGADLILPGIDDQVIQERILGRPGPETGQGDGEVLFGARDLGDGLSFRQYLDMNIMEVSLQTQSDFLLVEKRNDLYFFDRFFRQLLDPDALPDPGCGGIEDPAVL